MEKGPQSSYTVTAGEVPPFRYIREETEAQKGFPGELADKESACNAGDLGSIHG